jgi:excisionase family DNA binding protein
MSDNADELLTVAEVSAWLKKAPGTIYNLVSAGDIPFVKAGGSLRFRRGAIEAWLQEGGKPSENGEAA